MPSCWTAARALAEVKRRGQPSACAARVDHRAAAEQCASRGPPPPPPPPPPPWQPSMRASCGVWYRRFVEAKKMMSTPDGCLRLLDLIYGRDKGPPIVFDSSSDSPPRQNTKRQVLTSGKRRYQAQPTLGHVIGNYAACTRPGAGARTCSAICDPEVRGQDSLCFSAYRSSPSRRQSLNTNPRQVLRVSL